MDLYKSRCKPNNSITVSAATLTPWVPSAQWQWIHKPTVFFFTKCNSCLSSNSKLRAIWFCCGSQSLSSSFKESDIHISVSGNLCLYSCIIISDIQQAPFPSLTALKTHQPVLQSYQWMSDIVWEVKTWSELYFSPPTQSHSSELLRRTKGTGEPISLLRLVHAL